MVAAGHPAEPARRARPQAGLRALLRHLRRGGRVQRGVPHPQLPAEPVRRRRAVGVVHPGLRRPARRRDEARGAPAWRGAVAALLGAGRRRCWCWSGVLLTPWLIDVIAPGFDGREARAHRSGWCGSSSRAPGLLVLSAWCLGVLNSHRRFFLSYAAPVVWNARDDRRAGRVRRPAGSATDLAVIAAWGSVRGQRAAVRCVQLPTVLRRARRAPAAARRAARRTCATVLRNFGPVFVGRGVVQISAYVDTRAREPAARPARSPGSPTRRCSTRCR